VPDHPVFDLVVRGRIATPRDEPATGAIGIIDGRIAAVAESDAPMECDTEHDFADSLVFPGLVDVHVHTRSAADEGIEAATRAAAAGGVTTIVDMPFDASGPVDSIDIFSAKVTDVRQQALVDVALWATVPPEGPLDEVEPLVAAGACAFKLSTFETDPVRFPRIPDGQLLAAFDAVGRAGGLVGVHSENDEIVRSLIAAEQAAGRHDPLAHARSRPPVAETEAIARCLELARATGVRLHLCHVTLARGVELANRARSDGVDVSTESCPHYLVLDESELIHRGGEAKINPPLRPIEEVEALWRALTCGRLDIVSSDHVGWPASRKRGENIFTLASGAPSLELELPLMYDAVKRRDLPLSLLTRALAEAPARRFGLWPRKGALRPGADADLVVLDPDERWLVDPERLITPAGWSPYSGRELNGRIRHVLVRGETVFRDGTVVAAPGQGSFLPSNAATSEFAHA
jgi:allantoinase